MKTAGMIGGLGPESTAIYYRQIVAEYRKLKPDGSYPSIFINSVDMKKVLNFITADQLDELSHYLLKALEKLAAAGASFAFISANAPHIVYEDVQSQSPLPLVSIVETVCNAATKMAFTRLGLLGARFTMQAKFYPKVFSRQGIELVMPDQEEQNYIHEKYIDELVNGKIVRETRDHFVRIMRRLREQESVEGVILGGTELSLLFQEDSAGGMPLLDTTKLHVQAVLAELLR